MSEVATKDTGVAGEYQDMKIREAVEAYLRDEGGPVTPAEVAEATDNNPGSVRTEMRRMDDRGEIKSLPEELRDEPGEYDLPERVGDQGDSGPIPLLDDQTTLTVYTDVKAVAGEGRVVYPDEAQRTVEVPRHFISSLIGFSVPSTVGIHMVEGDSMHPTIQEDDLVLYKPVEEVRSGGVYVMLIDGGLSVKRVERIPGGGYKIISDNEYGSYPNYTLIPTDDNSELINQETDRAVDLRPVGSVIFPRRETDTLHVKQVAEIIRSVAGGEVKSSQLRGP